MSWPLKYDPASQSISFGGRDKNLYPNSLAPFDQAALAAGDVSRTYRDRDSGRGPRPENEHFELGEEKVEDNNNEGTASVVDHCPFDPSLDHTTSISYTRISQLEDPRQKQKEFVESLTRGKWNRYRRQCSSNTSCEAQDPTNSLSIIDHTSTFPHSPTHVPYLTFSDARRATLNNQATRELDLKDQSIKGKKWGSVSWSAESAAITLTMEKDLAIPDINLALSEARLSTPTERCCSPQLSVGEKQALVEANAPAPKDRFVFKHSNKELTRDPNIIHNTQNFFQRLLHPHANIIEPVLRLVTKVFCLKHNNKIQQQAEKRASEVDVPSKRDVKQWRARRGDYRPLFSGKWVQSIAKAIERGNESEGRGRPGVCEKNGVVGG